MVIPVFGFLFFPEGGLFGDNYTADELTKMYVIILATFSVGTFVGAPFIGALSDRFGRRKLLMCTYSANIIFYFVFIYGMSELSYWTMWAARLGAGLTGGSLLVVQSAIADVSSPEEKAKNFGITGVAFGLGFILGAIIGGILSDDVWHPWFGDMTPFFASNFITFLNIMFLVFVFKETNQHRTKKPISIFTGPKNVISGFKNPSLRHIFVVIFIITLGFNFFLQLFQFYVMDEFEFNRTQVGYLFGFIGLNIAMAQGVLLPYVSDRLRPMQILTFSIPAFAFSYLLILIPYHWAWFCALMVVLIIFQALTFPTTLAFVSNQANKDIQGETIGINQSVQSLAAATPILFTLIINSNYQLPMYIGFALTLLAWIYFMVFIRKKGSDFRV